MRKISLLLTAALLILGMALPSIADGKKKVKHPLCLLQAHTECTPAPRGSEADRCGCVLEVKNLSHDKVEGIKVNLKLRNGSRDFFDLEKEVDPIEAGKKAFVRFKWEDYYKRKLTPYIWITYKNDEGEEVTFEAEPPAWQGM